MQENGEADENNQD